MGAGAARAAASVALSDAEEGSSQDGDKNGGDSSMGEVNVDGMLANQRFKKGAVIMMADEMPERETPTCVPAAPNCMVRDLEDGSGSALVAVKDIASGDLFLVLGYESDDEDPQRVRMRTFV